MPNRTFLSNHFLIAMPNMEDPYFHETVIYLCEHTEKGAMGLVINQPLSMHLGEMLSQLKIKNVPADVAARQVLAGGPVKTETGYILHSTGGKWSSSFAITPEISVTTSVDILRAIAKGNGPDNVVVTLGYASWEPGQLEAELMDNVWLTGPASKNIIFDTPMINRWRNAALSIGVDLNKLHGTPGHA